MNEKMQIEGTVQVNEAVQETQVTSDTEHRNQGTDQQAWWQKPKEQTLYQAKIKENFHIFGVSTFLYACLYALCMYQNASGVSYSFFVAGSLVYICFCLSKLGITWKRDNGFYMISMMLLSVSTFCTDDGRIIFFNKLGVFLLTVSMLLAIIYDTRKWNLGKYLSSICSSCMLALGQLGTPFADVLWYCKNKLDKKNSKYLYVLVGVVVTIPLFVVVFLLLTSADVVFWNMADSLLGGFDFGDIVAVAWMICLMFFACYCMLVQFCKKPLKEEVTDNRRGEPLIAIPVVTALSLLYLVFCGVQILYLFMGNMELPAGYTYAEYAREGFFQLLTVGILNLIIVLVCLYYFRSHKLLKTVLTIMSACTFVMLASSGMRMIIYIQYYYMTFLRILVLWSLAVLFLIFIGVMIYTHRESFPLFRYSMVVVTFLYLILSFSHPDYWIARINVESMQQNRSSFFKGEPYDDYRYLITLNADAAPVLLPYLEEQGFDLNYYYDWTLPVGRSGKDIEDSFGYDWLEHMREHTEDISLRSFNVSRFLMVQNVLNRAADGK